MAACPSPPHPVSSSWGTRRYRPGQLRGQGEFMHVKHSGPWLARDGRGSRQQLSPPSPITSPPRDFTCPLADFLDAPGKRKLPGRPLRGTDTQQVLAQIFTNWMPGDSRGGSGAGGPGAIAAGVQRAFPSGCPPLPEGHSPESPRHSQKRPSSRLEWGQPGAVTSVLSPLLLAWLCARPPPAALPATWRPPQRRGTARGGEVGAISQEAS